MRCLKSRFLMALILRGRGCAHLRRDVTCKARSIRPTSCSHAHGPWIARIIRHQRLSRWRPLYVCCALRETVRASVRRDCWREKIRWRQHAFLIFTAWTWRSVRLCRSVMQSMSAPLKQTPNCGMPRTSICSVPNVRCWWRPALPLKHWHRVRCCQLWK